MKIKLCGLSRPQGIEAANALMPDYVGFVFARKSRRYISPETAAALRKQLNPAIQTVGVFTDEEPELVAALVRDHIIDMIQLHGHEDRDYIRYLRTLTSAPIIQAVCIRNESDLERAQESSADLILLDSAAGGSGVSFDWNLLSRVTRPYFLAGGLTAENVRDALAVALPYALTAAAPCALAAAAPCAPASTAPYAVDVSSGIETDGWKDKIKMEQFVRAVRSATAMK